MASKQLIIGLLMLLSLGGCATTKPWEREDLARPEMSPDGHHRQALKGHYLSVREGSAGGTGSGGGGCGCN